MPSKEMAIAGLYDGIYLFYEKANFLLTAGLDRGWRRAAARQALRLAPGAATALDVCCGTGDFSLELEKAWGGSLKVTGSDLSEAMLSKARARAPGLDFVQAEAKALPFPDSSFDLVSISFATRNLATDRPGLLAALSEFRRVLRPGGLFLNLETSAPENPLLRALFRTYVRLSIGALNLLSPSTKASYTFLRNTILGFCGAAELSALLSEAGFRSPAFRRLFPGAVAIHTAVK
jgi:demethylmenaquinone methyltransferase/2-methoxy-6-polyprenyl-1,4-benzoquinol methylase